MVVTEEIAEAWVGFGGVEVTGVVGPVSGVSFAIGEGEEVVVSIVCVGGGDVVAVGVALYSASYVVDVGGGFAVCIGAD